MKIVIFCHSLASDWNHGNVHFLRGVAVELMARGVDVEVYEPEDSDQSPLTGESGERAVEGFHQAYPEFKANTYDLATLNLNRALSGADAVIVHEWNNPDLVRRIGEHRAQKGRYALLYHDSYHRPRIDRESLSALDLQSYDGALVFASVVRNAYLAYGLVPRAWTWLEAADTRLFHPIPSAKEGDLVWIGNWGEERDPELQEFLIEPVRRLAIKARVFGTGYSARTIRNLYNAGIEYGGWLPSFEAPQVYAKYRVTLHIPRHAAARALDGFPPISMFEALACGIPLVSAPWTDSERLFAKADYLTARYQEEMEAQITWVLHNEEGAREVAGHGRRTILERHTSSHRADELLQIVDSVQRDIVREKTA